MRSVKVSHSIISPDTIGDFVTESYFSSENIKCTFILQGINDTYLIEVGNAKYVFRLYRYGWRTHENISFEIEFLNYLDVASAPIAGIISDKYGRALQVIACPEGERYGVLMPCAGDNELESHCVVSGDAFNYGKSLGQLHKSALGFQSQSGATTIDVDHLIWHPLKLVEKTFSENFDDIQYLYRVAKMLAESIAKLERSGLAKGFIHGDVTGGNASSTSRGDYVFFDFDCCGYGWTAYDLAVFRWSCMLNQKEAPLWQEFIDGYQLAMDISEADFAVIPLLVLARNFWIMGYSVSQIGIKGKLSYRPRQFQRDIQFFRDREETDLSIHNPI